MGFRREPTAYKLRFEDPSLEGLEVVAKSLPLRDFLEISKLGTEEDTSKQVAGNEALIKKFATALIGWNLEDENGKAVPADYKGLLSQEFPFVMQIIRAWMEAIASVPKSLNNGLNGSGTYPEQSIPMEVS